MARAIRSAGPTVILLSAELTDESTDGLFRAGGGEPAFRETLVILVGACPVTLSGWGPVQVEAARGRRVSDLAGQVRAALAQWRTREAMTN